jgi:hypothetical protein
MQNRNLVSAPTEEPMQPQNTILSRELRMFKPLFWMLGASVLLLGGMMALGAARPEPPAPAPVVLHEHEAVEVEQVMVKLPDELAVPLPEGLHALTRLRIELPPETEFSHPVTLNFAGTAGDTVLMLVDDEWQVLESSRGRHPQVARSAQVSEPGLYVLASD